MRGSARHCGCSDAGGVSLGEDEGAEAGRVLKLAGRRGGVGGDAFDAAGGGLLELLAEDGGVDAEFLRGVGGELVALEARWACGGCAAAGS